MTVSVTAPTVYPIIVPTSSSLKSYNFYLVQYEDVLFLVDAGEDTEDCWNYFNRTLRKNNLKISDLDAIILTHNHVDHIGLVNRIRTHHSLDVFAHPDAFVRLKRDQSFLEERVAFFNSLYKQMGSGDEAVKQIKNMRSAITRNKSQKIDGEIKPIREGDKLFGFQVIEVFGHAPDHIALFHEASGMLLSGDHVIKNMSTNALVELGTDGNRTQSLVLYEYALKKIAHLPLQVIYPGHGDIIDAPQEAVFKNMERIQKKADRLMSHLNERQTAAQLAQKIYKDKYKTLFPLVMSEIIGQLDRLENLRKVTKSKHEDVFYYEKKKD